MDWIIYLLEKNNMKTVLLLLPLILFLSCVQKTHHRSVHIRVHCDKQDSIHTIGIRGDSAPLSWEKDILAKTLITDSLFELHYSTNTGYLFHEYKLTLNGTFENGSNRKVTFNNVGDTTFIELFVNRN